MTKNGWQESPPAIHFYVRGNQTNILITILLARVVGQNLPEVVITVDKPSGVSGRVG